MWELCWKKCYTQYTYGHKHTPTYGCDLPTYLCWPLPEATSTEQTQPCRGARSYSFPFGSNYLCALYSQRTCHFLPISGGSCSWKTSTNPLWSCESEETQQCYFDLTHKQKMKTTKSRAMIYHASLSIVISEINRRVGLKLESLTSCALLVLMLFKWRSKNTSLCRSTEGCLRL